MKYLRNQTGYTQKEVAKKLGIGQSAVANYEQGLRFPNERILKGLSALYNVSLDFLLGNLRRSATEEPSFLSDIKDLPSRYQSLFMEHRKEEALDLLLRQLDSGIPLDRLFDEVLLPVLRHTGDLWERGELTVAEEHLLSAEIERTVGILSYLTPRSPFTGRSCISTCAGPEMHCIGARMAAELLATHGWNSRYLGMHTPTLDVLALCEDMKADLLIVSATLDRHLEAVGALCNALKARESLAHCKILVGGAAFDRHPGVWKSLGAQGYAKSISDCESLADVLVPG